MLASLLRIILLTATLKILERGLDKGPIILPDNKNNAIELVDNKCTVTHLLQKIKPSDRKLLYEIFFLNISVKELSKKYHVSPQAIYQHYKRIICKLKT